MPAGKQIILTRAQRDEMLNHALQETPNECCGLLIGKGRRVKQVVKIKSDNPSPDAYYMNAEEQVAVFTEMAARGEELLGIYHSHPKGPAWPSGADLQLAFHPEVAYFIISLADMDNPALHAFRIHHGAFEETAFKLTA